MKEYQLSLWKYIGNIKQIPYYNRYVNNLSGFPHYHEAIKCLNDAQTNVQYKLHTELLTSYNNCNDKYKRTGLNIISMNTMKFNIIYLAKRIIINLSVSIVKSA